MPKASILFISTQLPFPPKSGGTIKSWYYLQDLSKRYRLGLACLLKDDDEEHLEKLQEKLVFKDFIYQKHQLGRSPINLLKSYLGHACLNVYRNYSASFSRQVEQLASSYDILLIDHYEMFQYVPKNYSGKVVMHTHNAEFALWNRMAELSGNPLIRFALKMEARRVKQYEKEIFERSDLIYTTPSDLESYLDEGFPDQKIANTFHLGKDDLLKLPPMQFGDTEKSLIFMGTLSWEPNLDGICWFIEQVFPKIIENEKDLTLYVLGKEPGERLKRLAQFYPQVQLCGFIEDLDTYLKKSRVFLVPLRFGSGMKVKVLEGMYRGIPMVCSEVGAEGLDIEDGKEVLIAETADEFCSAILKLMFDQQLWENISRESRKKAAEKYTWQPLFDQMDQDLQAVLHE